MKKIKLLIAGEEVIRYTNDRTIQYMYTVLSYLIDKINY